MDGMGELTAGGLIAALGWRCDVPDEYAAQVEEAVAQSGDVWHAGRNGFDDEGDWQAWRRWVAWRKLVIGDRAEHKESPAPEEEAGLSGEG